MKLVMFKQSGDLVDESVRELYDADWKVFYDKAELRAKDEKKPLGVNVNKLNRFLSYGERQLYKKYSRDITESIPTSAKQWKLLLAKYGSNPIMVAHRADRDELILVIMDNL